MLLTFYLMAYHRKAKFTKEVSKRERKKGTTKLSENSEQMPRVSHY
jgi:hypothetical protein